MLLKVNRSKGIAIYTTRISLFLEVRRMWYVIIAKNSWNKFTRIKYNYE